MEISGLEFTEVVEDISLGFEVVGILIIIVGGSIGIVSAARNATSRTAFYELARAGFARPLLLGLEVLVAADIIDTIVVDRTLESTAALGLLVVIRVVLSISLGAETDGMLPWRRAQLEVQRDAVAARGADGPEPDPTHRA